VLKSGYVGGRGGGGFACGGCEGFSARGERVRGPGWKEERGHVEWGFAVSSGNVGWAVRLEDGLAVYGGELRVAWRGARGAKDFV
jgi:hypothetical protein